MRGRRGHRLAACIRAQLALERFEDLGGRRPLAWLVSSALANDGNGVRRRGRLGGSPRAQRILDAVGRVEVAAGDERDELLRHRHAGAEGVIGCQRHRLAVGGACAGIRRLEGEQPHEHAAERPEVGRRELEAVHGRQVDHANLSAEHLGRGVESMLVDVLGRVRVRLAKLALLEQHMDWQAIVGDLDAHLAIEHHVARVQRQVGSAHHVQRAETRGERASKPRPPRVQLGGQVLVCLRLLDQPLKRA